MATLGFVRNNPWVQQDKLRRDSGPSATDTFARMAAPSLIYSSEAPAATMSRSISDGEAAFRSARAASTEEEGDPEYGPGIVRLLRDKFLQLAETASREAEATRWKHSAVRKAQSLESLLDGPVMNTSVSEPPDPTRLKAFGSTAAILQDEDPPTPRAASPQAPEETIQSIKAKFEGGKQSSVASSPSKPPPKRLLADLEPREPEFLAAFKKLKPVAAAASPENRRAPADPGQTALPTLITQNVDASPPLGSPASATSSEVSPPPDEPHPPPTFAPTPPVVSTTTVQLNRPTSPIIILPSPVDECLAEASDAKEEEDNDAGSSCSESGLTGSYDLTPTPSSDSVPPKDSGSDSAYPPSPPQTTAERSASPPAEAKELLQSFADKVVASLTSPPLRDDDDDAPPVVQVIARVPDTLADSQAAADLLDADKDRVMVLLEEYRGVLPLVAEEDLPELLAPEKIFVYEFEGEIGLVPSESNLQKEPKAAKGTVGFDAAPHGAYAYVAASETSDDEEIAWDWVEGVVIDHVAYNSLCREIRTEKEAMWSDLNSWVENSAPVATIDASWADKAPPLTQGGGGLVNYVPSQMQGDSFSAESNRSWDYGTSEQAAESKATKEAEATEAPESFSKNEEKSSDLLF